MFRLPLPRSTGNKLPDHPVNHLSKHIQSGGEPGASCGFKLCIHWSLSIKYRSSAALMLARVGLSAWQIGQTFHALVTHGHSPGGAFNIQPNSASQTICEHHFLVIIVGRILPAGRRSFGIQFARRRSPGLRTSRKWDAREADPRTAGFDASCSKIRAFHTKDQSSYDCNPPSKCGDVRSVFGGRNFPLKICKTAETS